MTDANTKARKRWIKDQSWRDRAENAVVVISALVLILAAIGAASTWDAAESQTYQQERISS